MIVEEFKESLSPRRLILNKRGDTLFDRNYGIYSEVGVVLFNFTRNDEIYYE